MPDVIRCPWSMAHEEEMRYHDEEWGVPCYDDTTLFEFLTLEAAQAGLSWRTILLKRDGYRRCFAQFDAAKVAAFTEKDQERLLQDAGIVRNKLKVAAAISNARLFLEVAAKHGSFSTYLWNFVDGTPLQNARKRIEDVPATTPLSDTIAKELKKLGFKFLGSTVMYAHMQATGMVNDHLVSCFRYEAVKEMGKR